MIPGRAQAEYVLFVRDRDPLRELWDGGRAGPEGAINRYGADDAFPIDDIDDILPGLMENSSRVFYTMGVSADFDQRVIGWVNGLKAQSRPRCASVTGVRWRWIIICTTARLYKSKPELDSMRRSAQIAVDAHKRAMRFTNPGRMEYEVMAGASRTSFAATMQIFLITRLSVAARIPARCTTMKTMPNWSTAIYS